MLKSKAYKFTRKSHVTWAIWGFHAKCVDQVWGGAVGKGYDFTWASTWYIGMDVKNAC